MPSVRLPVARQVARFLGCAEIRPNSKSTSRGLAGLTDLVVSGKVALIRGCRSPIGGRDGYEASPNCGIKLIPYRIL